MVELELKPRSVLGTKSGLSKFFCKWPLQITNILGFSGHILSVSTSQLCLQL